MPVLVWGNAVVAAAFLLHLALWRIRVPHRQTRALLLLFFGTLTAALIGFNASGALGWQLPWLPGQAPAQAHIALYVTAMTLGYVITYSALEADSPSVVMLLAVSGAGEEGLPEATFRSQLTDDILVVPRVEDLVRDGLATEEAGRYLISSKGRRFVRIFVFYRALLGIGKGG